MMSSHIPIPFRESTPASPLFFTFPEMQEQHFRLVFTPQQDFALPSLLKPALNHNAFYKFLNRTPIPIAHSSKFRILTTPPQLYGSLKHNYMYLKENEHFKPESYYCEVNLLSSISFCDTALALLATEFGLSVISYDHHLANDLPKFLAYECLRPFDVVKFQLKGTFLLDANVLIHLIN